MPLKLTLFLLLFLDSQFLLSIALASFCICCTCLLCTDIFLSAATVYSNNLNLAIRPLHELSDARARFFPTTSTRFTKPPRQAANCVYNERHREFKSGCILFPTKKAHCHHYDRDGGRGQVDLCTATQFLSAHRQPIAAAVHPQSRSSSVPCPV